MTQQRFFKNPVRQAIGILSLITEIVCFIIIGIFFPSENPLVLTVGNIVAIAWLFIATFGLMMIAIDGSRWPGGLSFGLLAVVAIISSTMTDAKPLEPSVNFLVTIEMWILIGVNFIDVLDGLVKEVKKLRSN